jgi:hypothetical protein
MSTGGGPSEPRRDKEAEDEQTFADVLNAFSFDNARRRLKTSRNRGTPRDVARPEREEAPPPPDAEPFGHAPLLHDAESFGHPPLVHDQPTTWEPGKAEREAPAAFVRAYVWTGGRTKSSHHFEVETLVSAAEPSSTPGAVTQSDRTVLGLCHEPRSVAEVAALLTVPLGVAKVLLGDMADRGMIVVHGAATGPGAAPSHALMERVLTGLRGL